MHGPDEAQRALRRLPPVRHQHIDFGKQAASYIKDRAAELEGAGDTRGAIALLAATAPLLEHPRDRIWVTSELVMLLRRAGQTARAQQYHRAVAAAVERDRRPAMRYFYLFMHMPGAVGGVDTLSLHAAELACRYRAYTLCGSSLSSVAAYHLDNGNPQSAIEFGERALREVERAGAPYYVSTVRMRLGRAYLRAGEYARAEATLKQAVRSARAAGSSYLLAESLHNLAHTYEGSARWPLARQTVAAFVEAAAPLHDSQRIVSLRDAGLIFWDSGERAAARDFFKRMVSLIDLRETDHFWAGEFYEREGALRVARGYYARALKSSGDTARITGGLVRVYLALGERDSAEHAARMHDRASQTPEEVPLMPEVLAEHGDFTRAIALAEAWAGRKESERNLIGAANAWLQVGELALRNGDAATAVRAALRADTLAGRANLAAQRTRARLLRGRSELQLGTPTATRTLERAVHAARMTGTPLLQAQAFSALAEARLRDGHGQAAVHTADSALRHFRRITDRFNDDFDRGRFAAQRARPYQLGLAVLLQRNDAAALLAWLQQHKTQGSAARRNHVPLAQVQRSLGADAAVIDYAVLDTMIIAVVVKRAALHVVRLPGTAAELAKLVDRLRHSTESHLGRIDWARATYDHRSAHLLYRVLLEPIEPYLTSINRLFIVPDASLHLVPFDALVTDAGKRSYVIDTREVTYLPASSDIGPHRGDRYNTVGVVRTEAPATQREARLLAARGALTIEPTERGVRSALRQLDVVHFATHAQANLQQPLSSFLRLRPDSSGDGLLHLGEIAALRSAARLVFLSACETQRGRVFDGIGIMGMAHAFLNSGTPAVIATHWPVGGSAATIADVFYGQLHAGRTPAAALRTAKLTLRHDPLTTDPLHWGAFMLVTSSRHP